MSQKIYTVTQECELLPFLIATLPDKSRTTIKSYLSHRQIMVGKQVCTQFNARLKAADTVTLFLERRTDELRHPMVKIVYEDDVLIVIEKQSGLLSMGTDRERMKTAFFILSEHVKRADSKNRIFILHRLDRDTSGLMMFAKSEAIKTQMQAAWDTVVLERKYVAAIEGQMDRPEGTISTYLTENSGYKVFVSNKIEGDLAITSYRVVKSTPAYSLVELSLSTGKKNQIRAHMEYVGHPVVGDKKYGAHGNPIGRVALHASLLRFIHPTTGEDMSFSASVPGKFSALF